MIKRHSTSKKILELLVDSPFGSIELDYFKIKEISGNKRNESKFWNIVRDLIKKKKISHDLESNSITLVKITRQQRKRYIQLKEGTYPFIKPVVIGSPERGKFGKNYILVHPLSRDLTKWGLSAFDHNGKWNHFKSVEGTQEDVEKQAIQYAYDWKKLNSPEHWEKLFTPQD